MLGKALRKTLLIVTVVCPCVSLAAQNEEWNTKIEQLSFLGRNAANDYRLGTGDLIEVSVFGVKELNQVLRVNSSGTITLPFLGAVAVAGLSAAELEQELCSLLGEKLIKNPQVSVFVKEYRSQPVFVLGAVRNPGQYQITQELNLIDAIAMAGGLQLDKAADFAWIQRKGTADANGASKIKIDLKELLEGGNISLNIPIQGGDVIQVPERETRLFYVIGEVGRAGAFAYPENQELLVSQALAWAGGPAKTAKVSDGILLRYENGARKEIAVNFNDILKGRKPDVSVHPQDIIFIPGSTFKSIGYGLLGVIPGTASQAVIYGPITR